MIEYLLFYSLIGGLFSLLGGLLLLWVPQLTKKIMTPLMAFGAGAFLSAAFLDILPEALEQAVEPQEVLSAALVGFLLFFIFERGVAQYFKNSSERSGQSKHTESLATLLILGDSVHNFMDGIVIAIAFAANPVLGLSTALAIAAHEIPQEIGDFSILLHLGWRKSKIVLVNILQSLLTVPGVFIGYYLGQVIEPQLPLLLGVTAGFFIYIAATDLLPELHHRAGNRQFVKVVLPMTLSVLVISQLISLAHSH